LETLAHGSEVEARSGDIPVDYNTSELRRRCKGAGFGRRLICSQPSGEELEEARGQKNKRGRSAAKGGHRVHPSLQF
jgi:hypothetical protein